MGKFIEDFKAFALKGNVVDMAVGIIIGGAFGKIVTSVVNDIITPPIGVLISGVDFKDLKITIKEAVPAVTDAAGNVVTAATDAVSINYGAFIQTCIDFLIIALTIFMVIKLISRLSELKKKKEEVKEEPAPAPKEPEPTKEELLLAEIRDLLKEKK